MVDVLDRSARPLSDVARHLVIPDGIVDTLWFDVEARCREFGDEFDVWQDGLGQVVLGLREDGMFAATEGGVGLSIPRQVAKTFIVGRIAVALCTLFDDLTVLWTAHHLRTSTMTFHKMKSYVMSAPVREHIESGTNQGTAIRDANGEQEIPFRNGSKIMFGSRKQGFGRGFDEVDVEVFDEAQILAEQALEDMVPATNQSRFIHGALLFYMGTPPRPSDPGEVFTLRRDEALKAKGDVEPFSDPVATGDAVYIECSADVDADPDDPEQVSKANPSYPHRTPPASIRRMRKNLPSVESFMRDGLGVWDEISQGYCPLDLTVWAASVRDGGLTDATSAVTAATAQVAVDKDTDWYQASIAGVRPDGLHHVGTLVANMDRATFLTDLVEACKALDVRSVTLPDGSPAQALESDLIALGFTVYLMKPKEQALAFEQFVNATKGAAPLLRHRGEPKMRKALEQATTKPWGDGGEMWSRRTTKGDVAPLTAPTMAYGRIGAADIRRSAYEDEDVMFV